MRLKDVITGLKAAGLLPEKLSKPARNAEGVFHRYDDHQHGRTEMFEWEIEDVGNYAGGFEALLTLAQPHVRPTNVRVESRGSGDEFAFLFEHDGQSVEWVRLFDPRVYDAEWLDLAIDTINSMSKLCLVNVGPCEYGWMVAAVEPDHRALFEALRALNKHPY